MVPARRKEYQKPEMLGKYTWRDASGKVWRYSPESGGHPLLMETPPLRIDDLVVPAEVQIDESRLEALACVIREWCRVIWSSEN